MPKGKCGFQKGHPHFGSEKSLVGAELTARRKPVPEASKPVKPEPNRGPGVKFEKGHRGYRTKQSYAKASLVRRGLATKEPKVDGRILANRNPEKKGTFQKGHGLGVSKGTGHRPGDRISEHDPGGLWRLGFDALHEMLTMYHDPTLDKSLKVKIICELASYQYAKKRSVEVTGADNGPIQVTIRKFELPALTAVQSVVSLPIIAAAAGE